MKFLATLLAATSYSLSFAAPQDPLTLSQAVSTAFSTRSSLRAQLEKVLAAEASERAAAIEPPLRVEFGYGTHPELGIGNDLLLAIPVDLFGKNAAERSVAHAEVLSARAELNQSAVELQTEVFTAYSELLSAQDELESASALGEIIQQSYDATKKRIESGDLPPNQLLKSDLELRRSKQTIASDELNLEAAKASFVGILGVGAAGAQKLDGAVPLLPEIAPIEHRPDIEVAKAVFDSASAERNVARSSSAPDFEFQIAHDYWDTSGHFTARAQFVWNFFDYGAAAGRRSAALHNQKSADLALQDLIAQARTQVTASRATYDAAAKDVQSYRQLATDAKEILQKEEKAFALGANTLLDVLDATRSYREILDSQRQARVKLITAQGKLFSVTGTLVGTFPKK